MSHQGGGSIGEETRDLVASPSIFFGAVGKTAIHSESLKQKTQGHLEAIIQNIQSEPYELKAECCLYCQNKDVRNRSFRPKTEKTVGGLKLALSIRRKNARNTGVLVLLLKN